MLESSLLLASWPQLSVEDPSLAVLLEPVAVVLLLVQVLLQPDLLLVALHEMHLSSSLVLQHLLLVQGAVQVPLRLELPWLLSWLLQVTAHSLRPVHCLALAPASSSLGL